MLRTAIGNSLSLTQLSLALQAMVAAILLGEFYHEADTATQFGMTAARAMDNFEKQVAELAKRESAAVRAVADAGCRPVREIRFDNVSFGYRGARRAVFDGLDLTLRAGECTAIVGLNGAGKTTLVKLLARLYEPTGGKISVDGCDVRDFSADEWRRRIAIVFQDFVRYELSVTDNIAFGAVDYDAGQQSIRRAAAAAGIGDFVESLPRGASTPLARHYDGGTELSGGQWQRIAIARALYAVEAGANVLVLDEPTAALDVRAEAAFFAEFAKQTKGLTTLLISHRFSSVRHADRIVVLSQGQVVEDGTHDALLAHGGMYARLFDLQARRFHTDRSSADDGTEARSWPA
jgi:ATP-binding cassette subfamily B protein